MVTYNIFLIMANGNVPTIEFIYSLRIFIILEMIAGIVLFEVAYKKDKETIFLHGLEFLGIASSSLIFLNLYSRQSPKTLLSIMITQIVIAIYYIIKCIVIAIMKKRK